MTGRGLELPVLRFERTSATGIGALHVGPFGAGFGQGGFVPGIQNEQQQAKLDASCQKVAREDGVRRQRIGYDSRV